MFISPAFAQTAGAASGSDPSFFLQFGYLPLILGILYFLVFRPQQQAANAQRAKIDAVKKGDSVVTGGGLLGKVTRVEDDKVEIELGPNVKVRALKVTLSDVLPLGGGKAAND